VYLAADHDVADILAQSRAIRAKKSSHPPSREPGSPLVHVAAQQPSVVAAQQASVVAAQQHQSFVAAQQQSSQSAANTGTPQKQTRSHSPSAHAHQVADHTSILNNGQSNDHHSTSRVHGADFHARSRAQSAQIAQSAGVQGTTVGKISQTGQTGGGERISADDARAKAMYMHFKQIEMDEDDCF
jgi:hypothetical protein